MLYVIRQTRHYYGPYVVRSLVSHCNGRAEQFDTRASLLTSLNRCNMTIRTPPECLHAYLAPIAARRGVSLWKGAK